MTALPHRSHRLRLGRCAACGLLPASTAIADRCSRRFLRHAAELVLLDLTRWPCPLPGPLVLQVVLPGEPVAWGRPRIEARGTKLRVIVNPAATTAAETAWRLALRPLVDGPPRAGPLGLRLLFACHDGRRKDLDNLTKTVCDAGTGVIWLDDAQIVELAARVVRGVPDPATALCVYALAEEN